MFLAIHGFLQTITVARRLLSVHGFRLGTDIRRLEHEVRMKHDWGDNEWHRDIGVRGVGLCMGFFSSASIKIAVLSSNGILHASNRDAERWHAIR